MASPDGETIQGGTLFKGGIYRDTIHGMSCFDAMNIDVAISQTLDLLKSWSDN